MGESVYKSIFVVLLLAFCWLAMMAVHEFGHIIGAILSGSTIEQVVLSPLTISRTDVRPNNAPTLVVWLGPILGCLIPWLFAWIIPQHRTVEKNIGLFWGGFCLIANGAYIGLGSIDQIGDCGEMLRNGSPPAALWGFGILAVGSGFYAWHRLGSVQQFLVQPFEVDHQTTLGLTTLVAAMAGIGWLFFSG
ncbi:MAG: hypothetical protein ACI814_004139 [Mariniblastus sp.]|jgi:hypothetical protein